MYLAIFKQKNARNSKKISKKFDSIFEAHIFLAKCFSKINTKKYFRFETEVLKINSKTLF